MRKIRLFEAFLDAIKLIENRRKGECNLYKIWTDLGGKFKWNGEEINLKEFTGQNIFSKPEIPVVISKDFEHKHCTLDSISIQNGEIVGCVNIESAKRRYQDFFPLSTINLDRSEEHLFTTGQKLKNTLKK